MELNAQAGQIRLTEAQLIECLREEGIDFHSLDSNEKPRISTCIATAPAILARACKLEKDVTPQLQSMCAAAGGELVGLDHKLKSLSSLCRKIAVNALANEAIFPENIGSFITDALRYTVVLDSFQYAIGVSNIINSLSKVGFDVLKKNNYWAEENCYKGINTVWVKGHGLCFEVQFHTHQSFDLKELVLHPLYEKCRALEGLLMLEGPSSNTLIMEEIQSVKSKMRKASQVILIPEDADTIGNVVYDR